MTKPKLTQDELVNDFDQWDGTLFGLAEIVNSLVDEYGPTKRLIMDAGYNNISFRIDHSDIRAHEQELWNAAQPKTLKKSELDKHKTKVILNLLHHAGVKLTDAEIESRISTGKGFDDLLNP